LGLEGGSDERSVVAAAYGFCESLGVEMRMSGLGVPIDDLGNMADEAHVIWRLLDNNPREINREILAIYRATL
jgi:alcohol dehydrogenase class IV